MTVADFDPVSARGAILAALGAWARQRDRMPEQRAALLAAAWHAGEHNIRELARVADVSPQTVYTDLHGQSINPRHDRDTAARPRYAPLNHDQVYDLVQHMRGVLLPSMLASQPEPLAAAAWMALKAVDRIAELLDPASTADRADELHEIAHCADSIRRKAHEQWAAEANRTELARFTENATIADAEIGTALMTGKTTVTVLLPDGMTPVTVTLSTAGPSDQDPDGWTAWTSDAPLPLGPVTGVVHLEIQSLLTSLSELITQALHPELLEER